MADLDTDAQNSKYLGSSKVFWVIVCVVLILGVTVRIYGLTRQSLWLDEANRDQNR